MAQLRIAACAPIPFQEVNEQVGARGEDRPTPAKLRDLADTLGRFGIGLIPDPRFPARLPSSSTVLLFRLDGPREAVDLPSDAYKAAFLSLAVGMLVAKADGRSPMGSGPSCANWRRRRPDSRPTSVTASRPMHPGSKPIPPSCRRCARDWPNSATSSGKPSAIV